jgi:hypothetical protein
MGAGDAARETGRRVLLRLRAWPKWVRVPVGLLFLVGGVLGFLPVLGFWMIPIGLAILALDIPIAAKAYRWLRRQIIRLVRRLRGKRKSGS